MEGGALWTKQKEDVGVRGYPWWAFLLLDLVILGGVSLAAKHYGASGEFSFTWGLCASVIAICFEVLAEQRRVTSHIHRLTRDLPKHIFNHDVFQNVLLAERFLAIYGMENPLFAKIARNQIDNLNALLGKLQVGEFELIGTQVLDTYKDLICSLGHGQTYKATTYVDDATWSTEAGRAFLRCNVDAVKRGAHITRIFLHQGEPTAKLLECEVIKLHVAARASLPPGTKGSLELKTLNTNNVLIGDVGILNGQYLMQITSDPHLGRPDAKVKTDRNSIERAEGAWQRAYAMADEVPVPPHRPPAKSGR